MSYNADVTKRKVIYMKKVFSLMLSLVMIVCVTIGDSISTFADAPTVIDLRQSVDGEAVESVYYEFSVVYFPVYKRCYRNQKEDIYTYIGYGY